MANPTPSILHVADDALFDQHRSRGYHPERPERLGAARRAIERCPAIGVTPATLAPRDATHDELLRAHAAAYLAELDRLDGHYAAVDADTYVAPASIAAAKRAAGGTIALVEALLGKGPAGTPASPRGVALLRPPGHHATRARGMGFCLINNVAVGAAWALANGIDRVAIIDLDVHHGNGTQDIFWGDRRVLYASLHEMPLYPGTGAAREIGEADGVGYTVNVPLSAGADDAVYRLAFERVVLPVLSQFAPELVLVSAGYDAHERDPLASMRLTDAGYGWMARALAKVADTSARGRLGVVLEGGYDLSGIEASLFATIRGITGQVGEGEAPTGQVALRYRDEVEAARRAAARTWKL